MAALRRRDLTGEGARINLALADVALAAVANLGWFSDAQRLLGDRERQANGIYGSYGQDFATADGHRVMVVALTPQNKIAVIDTQSLKLLESTDPSRHLGRAQRGRALGGAPPAHAPRQRRLGPARHP